MKSNTIKKEESRHAEDYRKRMNSIKFMLQYVEDDEIFNPDSTKFKTFLIQSFAHLHSDFHYLSFLSNEDVDQELIKVAGILQILPTFSVKKGATLFDNMSENDIHKFWIRFFTLFDTGKNVNFSFGSTLNLSCENKIDFLKSIDSTLNYLKYNFPVVNLQKLKNIDLNEEIEKWNEQTNSKITMNETQVSEYDIEQISDVNIEKLIIDLKHIGMTYKDLDLVVKENETSYCDFFIHFVELTKDILKYNNNLTIIDASFLNNIISKLPSVNEKDWSENLYFMKSCNNLIKVLKSKMNILD